MSLFTTTVYAQSNTLQDIFIAAHFFVKDLIALAVVLAFFLFVWGVVVFIVKAGDDEGRAEGKARMVWGVVILFIFVSLWGIVALLAEIFDLDNSPTCPPPEIGTGAMSVSSCYE